MSRREKTEDLVITWRCPLCEVEELEVVKHYFGGEAESWRTCDNCITNERMEEAMRHED